MAEIHRWPCGPYRGGHTICSFPSELASNTSYCVAPCSVVFKFQNMVCSGLNRPSWKTEPVKPYQKLPHPDWSRLLFDVRHESATKPHFIRRLSSWFNHRFTWCLARCNGDTMAFLQNPYCLTDLSKPTESLFIAAKAPNKRILQPMYRRNVWQWLYM